MERREEDQWSWWQETGEIHPLAATASFPATESGPPTIDGAAPISSGAESGSPNPAGAHDPDDPVRKALIALVAVLSLTLAGVSYQRWGSTTAAPAAASASTTSPSTTAPTTLASSVVTTIGAVTTATPTTTEAPTTTSTTTSPPSTSSQDPASTVANEALGTPGEPFDVTVVSTGQTSAEITWRSDECVGSRYQVGDFSPGGGGFPDVNRCWFNHVILAGDPAFSPPLTPGTTYTVRIEAIGRDGSASKPVEIQFTTSS